MISLTGSSIGCSCRRRPTTAHSNSFSTLLELLDPYRFTRGVKVTRPKTDLAPVMVRRLKEDIRAVQGGFPKRNVRRIEIDGLPEEAPELELSRLLDEYRIAREERYRSESSRVRHAAGLMVIRLRQQLLSSIEAFVRTLLVHRRTCCATGKKPTKTARHNLGSTPIKPSLS